MNTDTTPFWPIRVLIVEDEAVNRKILVGLLSKLVREVREAQNGFEALDVLRDFVPDLVLTDLSMPRLDGLSLIRELRLQGKTYPIFVLSAHQEEGIPERADELGATQFLTKPLRSATLQNALATVFGPIT